MQKVTKTLTTLGFSLLLGLISPLSSAEENTQQAPLTQSQETNSPVPPTSKNTTALNPNLVNINVASAAEIQDKLLNIGAKKAQAIVDYREKNGKFLNIEQLTEVSGIGKATLDKNRDRIILDESNRLSNQ